MAKYKPGDRVVVVFKPSVDQYINGVRIGGIKGTLKKFCGETLTIKKVLSDDWRETGMALYAVNETPSIDWFDVDIECLESELAQLNVTAIDDILE